MAPPVKRIMDLKNYTNVLPYASELFGIYQPLLGWKSKRIEERFNKGFENDKILILEKLKSEFTGQVDIKFNKESQVEIEIKPGALDTGKVRSFGSVLLNEVATKLPVHELYKPTIWKDLITYDFLDSILKETVTNEYTKLFDQLTVTVDPNIVISKEKSEETALGSFQRQLKFESAIAGALLYLVQQQEFNTLRDIFYATTNNWENIVALKKMYSSKNSTEAFLNIDNLNPQDKEHISSVSLSPISIIHLFRQYFFELDTFLGTPVKHVWLSPGSTVELMEVHTTKSLTEKTLETTLDMMAKSETTTTDQEEISDAVKEDNQRDVKFGASVTASYTQIQATSSLDYNNSQQQSREKTHKLMREKTEKLSSEIRKNVKTSFKMVTEVSDISGTRHTLTNSTQQLINYELRRKMRQVGIQVQDIGTYLCWQTYVDDPGRELGLAKLIHIAKPPELESIPHPDEIPLLQAFQEEKMVTIPFVSINGTNADNEGEVYRDGREVAEDEILGGSPERIKADFPQEFVCPRPKYRLTNVEFDSQGKPVTVSKRGAIDNTIRGKSTFTLHLDTADFGGQNSVQIKLILHWSPEDDANDDIIQKNKDNLANFKAKEMEEFKKVYVDNVRDRVDKASKIVSRNSDELRDEERIVIYRKLIQQMLLNGVSTPDDRTRHVVSELINSIFDVDKMLYFVAPEWWRPRIHRSIQQLQETSVRNIGPRKDTDNQDIVQHGLMNQVNTATLNSSESLMSSTTVGWGGIYDAYRDSYYITDTSEPAKLGSSLGWLLQLDGDNMRNAFLNAPWVKAVIPIRPGKEEAAINWLKGIEGMNGITNDVIYHSSNPNESDINGRPLEGRRLIDVLIDLGKKIKKKYEEGIEIGRYPKQNEVSDPNLVDEENTVTATPIDRVYEHGFFPLQNSFRANIDKNYEIFDQWIEILPTDQIVPVEVKYDPKTGRQIDA